MAKGNFDRSLVSCWKTTCFNIVVPGEMAHPFVAEIRKQLPGINVSEPSSHFPQAGCFVEVSVPSSSGNKFDKLLRLFCQKHRLPLREEGLIALLKNSQ